jgi:hypothetical protein
MCLACYGLLPRLYTVHPAAVHCCPLMTPRASRMACALTVLATVCGSRTLNSGHPVAMMISSASWAALFALVAYVSCGAAASAWLLAWGS